MMNQFKKENSISPMANVTAFAITATRLYLILLICSLLVLILFNGLRQTTNSVTVKLPSLATFEALHNKYPTTIWCPCQQIAVPYGNFISVSASFHQVCTSIFIDPIWTTSLYGYGSTANSYFQLDRPLLSKQHQLMGWLCAEFKIITDNAISSFNETMFVTSTVISRDSFVLQTAEIIRQLIEQTPINFHRMFNFIVEFTAGNLIPSVFNTDWSLEYGNISNDYMLRSTTRVFLNSTCNCVVSNSCNQSMQIGPPEFVLPGLIVGCWPIHGLRMSTLECLFSSNCINTIINYLDYFTQIDGSPPINFTLPDVPSLIINSLNNSIQSRFIPNTTTGTLIDNFFIEQWTNTSLYENYYTVCKPSKCRYEYIMQNDGLYVVTSILSVYGGLTLSLKGGGALSTKRP